MTVLMLTSYKANQIVIPIILIIYILQLGRQFMKSQRSEDKENINTLNSSLAQINTRKFRNFGQQIKAKLKRSDLNIQPTQKQIDTPSATKGTYRPYSSRLANLFKPAAQLKRANTRIATEPYQNKGKKSVSFNEIPLPGGATTSRSNGSRSILKNSSLNKLTLKSGKNSSSTASLQLPAKGAMKSSTSSSNFFDDDNSCENSNSNKILKQKYLKSLQNLKRTNRKYTDQIYPPLRTSLELGSSISSTTLNPAFKDIKWLRLSQMFKDKPITIWRANDKFPITFPKHKSSKGGPLFEKINYLVTVFNAVKYNRSLLQKMFQNQKVNEFGIYYVKINQNNVWKYIVLDDYVPVMKSKQTGQYYHAFFQTSISKTTQIWPYLLMKALAKVYTNYESLLYGSENEMLQELSNMQSRLVRIDRESNFEQVFDRVNTFNTTLLARDNEGILHPICNSIQDIESSSQSKTIIYEKSNQNYQRVTLNKKNLHEKIVQFYSIEMHQHVFSAVNQIRNSREEVLIRTIKIEEETSATISVVQKDHKHYIGTSYRYSYCWLRMLVVMKENSGYRWISGSYCKKKRSSVRLDLQPGEYYVVIMPEWQDKSYDLSLVYNGNVPGKFQSKSFRECPNILTESCMDLAQRFGQLKQINQNICTYNYIHRELGLIIQNINNQRNRGAVRVIRSVAGLQGQFPIQPINQQFKNQPTVEIDIKCLQHFTVVLKMVGGIQQNIMDMFDFGS